MTRQIKQQLVMIKIFLLSENRDSLPFATRNDCSSDDEMVKLEIPPLPVGQISRSKSRQNTRQAQSGLLPLLPTPPLSFDELNEEFISLAPPDK